MSKHNGQSFVLCIRNLQNGWFSSSKYSNQFYLLFLYWEIQTTWGNWNQVKHSCLLPGPCTLHYFRSQVIWFILYCSLDKNLKCKYPSQWCVIALFLRHDNPVPQIFRGRICFSLYQRTPCNICCISFNQAFSVIIPVFLICSFPHKSFWNI